MEKNIYELELHETMMIERDEYVGLIITRVPGGWLYGYRKDENSDVFVPFDNGFQSQYE